MTPHETSTANSTASPPPRRHRWLKRFLVLIAFIGIAIFFAPQIIAWSPMRHELPRLRLKGFQGAIRVGAASLSWSGPNILSDIELDAPDGKPFYKVRRVTENRGVWDTLFHRTAPLHVVMEDPVINMLVRSDGSNVEDALAPVIELLSERVVRERATKVVGGELRMADTAAGTQAAWTIVSADILTDAENGSANHVEFLAEEADSPTKGRLEVSLAWPSQFRNPPAADKAVHEFSFAAKQASLDRAQALVQRVWPELHLQGTLSGSAKGTIRGDTKLSDKSDVNAAWDVKLADLQIGSGHQPDLKTFAPGPTEFRGRLALTGLHCQLDDLHLHTDFSQLDGGLGFILKSPNSSSGAVAVDSSRIPELKLHGELDLVALAKLLPEALPMRQGTKLTAGRIAIDLATENDAGSPHWVGKLATSRIAGMIEGTELVWDQPLNVDFSARLDSGNYVIDKIQAQSDVLELHGGSTASGVHVEANCDLQKLLARLGQFLNTDEVEVHGRLTAAADFSRGSNGFLDIDSRLTLDDLTVRRLTTRMIEKRAGELQPEVNPPPPPPTRPMPAAGPPRTAREAAAQRRAERKERTQERRQERQARREANQIVEVPVQEWRTFWSDPKFQITSQTRVDFGNGALILNRFDVETEGLKLHGTGGLTEIPQQFVVALSGDVEYDLARLVERARELLGPHVLVQGEGSRRFSITGPLRIPAAAGENEQPLVSPGLMANGATGWSGANLFGLPVGPGEFEVTLAQGILASRPLAVPFGSGTLRLAPRVLLDGRPAHLALPAGPVLEKVELTDQFCDDWLKFIAPLLSQATRCSGQFSLDLDESLLPLTDPGSGSLAGRLHIERGQVLPGPLLDEINNLIGKIAVGAPQELLGLDKPLVQFAQQTVAFELHEGRIYHEAVESTARGIIVRTHGSVGLDQSLEMVATITLSEELAGRSRFLSRLQGRALEIPIAGTLRRPKLDARAMGKLAEQLGQNALDQLLNQGLRGFFEGRE
jgi:hypothetical protein